MARIAVVLDSTRQGRFGGETPVRTGRRRCRSRGPVGAPVASVRRAPPARTLRNYPTEDVARLGRRIDAADGFVLLTPEYNHGYSGALKNAMDHTFVQGHRKKVAFVGWGNVGAPGLSNNFDWSPSSLRWHRCVMQCTSCPI
jgi:NAD(P)H-dependent FMN reductase